MKYLPIFLSCLFLQLFAVGHCHSQDWQSGNRGKITIVIQPVFNGQPLKLHENYVNEHEDTLNIEILKFYLTNVRLDYLQAGEKSKETKLIKDAFLYDIEDPETSSFYSDSTPSGDLINVSFTVGVDSIDNTSGANGGDLDPVKGMYWAWNSGYIMAKLEGKSKVCRTLHNAFEFHIGGYMPPCNTARSVSLNLPRIEVKSGTNTLIKINADVAAWFKGNLDLSKQNSVLIPGKDAARMADNYSQMFSIDR